MIIVRYADDTIVGFEHQHEAEQFLADLKARLARFGLTLHPDKTRLIEFGRSAIANRQARGLGKPESFDFIFASHVLPFVADLYGAVAEIARCLVPGGLLVATRQGGDSTIRRAMSGIIGKARWNDFARLVMRTAPRDNASTAPDDRYRSAFTSATLDVEERVVPFQITWEDVEEWIGIRWLPLIPEDDRPRARRMLAEVSRDARGATFPLHEPLMLGRKPS